MNFTTIITKLAKSHFARYGLPFILFVTGGSFALREFATVRYEVSRHNKQMGVTPELLEEMGFKVRQQKTLEEEYENMVKTVDTNNWKNIRGPRPWEQPTQEYQQMIERRIAETKRTPKKQ
ncbi:cytochrome c oxidase assembly protein COX16 homolog, mitochondrial-like [Oppia nitens]|uniref:cytochrome c oxidase assembly protein COX16 homolog, mitochondrial-like n=1 Tax=Oppia nitens TaxID=1686743 RepID=UPI0023D9A459|nr:cytochrome c oxidase assembly protein COX16 homolog, mitochondrial-like [Oppia nitens]